MAQPVSSVLLNSKENAVNEVTFAKNQPEYRPLPALQYEDGTILTRWELSEEEVAEIIKTKSIYLEVSTFGRPLQPLRMFTKEPG